MVLNAVAQQAKLDTKIEETKMLIPAGIRVESIFDCLDRFQKGYISDTDLWSFCQQFGGSTSFGSLCTLVHEIQLRRPRDYTVISSRLSFRELGSFLLKLGTTEHEVMASSANDDEARSMSYLLQNSEPCPRCGVRIQRDADAAGCPSVTCTMCGTAFRCYTVQSDFPKRIPPPSVTGQYQVYRLLDEAAKAAVDMESARKQLASNANSDILCTLSTVFTHIAGGRMSMSIPELRRAFANNDSFVSESEVSMLRHRYLKKDGTDVMFADFVRQLTPRSSTLDM